jgi:hypothetical protein
MAKGGKQEGAGRPKGVANKATTQAREAIAMFVEGNVDRLNGWLEQIAADSPKDAFDRFMSVVEYHIPKLARVDNTLLGKDGQPTDPNIQEVRITLVDTRPDNS